MIDEFKPEVVVIDSLTALREHMDDTELAKMLRYLSLLIKEHNITAYITLNADTNFETVPFTKASTLADNIIGLRYAINEGGVIERYLSVIKARGAQTTPRKSTGTR
ncbi:RAD55 family ATPase [Thermococcus peptonophilus]|uniref:RAD55 family ATPase n=1 Tax=Thermococcus peptonophilus TaxID=53952 RepID=UPI000A62DF6B